MSARLSLNRQGIAALSRDILSRTSAAVAVEASRIAPRRTGRLAGSIRSYIVNDFRARVEAGAPYALFVELGTRRMAAQPYLRPALARIVNRLRGGRT